VVGEQKLWQKAKSLIIDEALVASGVNEGVDSETVTLIPSLPGKFSCDCQTLLHGCRTKLGPPDNEMSRRWSLLPGAL
jgi:hypothetical protein